MTSLPDKARFKARVLAWADRLDARVTSISVRSMPRKWASYSTTGRLTFDSQLLKQREELQDYVIAHELLHFHAPNHGRLWKSLMRAHLGEYELLERELRRVVREEFVSRSSTVDSGRDLATAGSRKSASFGGRSPGQT